MYYYEYMSISLLIAIGQILGKGRQKGFELACRLKAHRARQCGEAGFVRAALAVAAACEAAARTASSLRQQREESSVSLPSPFPLYLFKDRSPWHGAAYTQHFHSETTSPWQCPQRHTQ